MARKIYGTTIALPAPFVAGTCDPVDARLVVETKSDLTTPSTFGTVGDYCKIYEGIIIYVCSEKCSYMYVGPSVEGSGILSTEVQKETNWSKIADSKITPVGENDITLEWDAENGLRLKYKGNVISTIPSTDFIKDGMLNNVILNNNKLVFTFNTDSGKQDIEVDLSTFIDTYDGSNLKLKALSIIENADAPINGDSIDIAVSKISSILNTKANSNNVVTSINGQKGDITLDEYYTRDQINSMFAWYEQETTGIEST